MRGGEEGKERGRSEGLKQSKGGKERENRRSSVREEGKESEERKREVEGRKDRRAGKCGRNKQWSRLKSQDGK